MRLMKRMAGLFVLAALLALPRYGLAAEEKALFFDDFSGYKSQADLLKVWQVGEPAPERGPGAIAQWKLKDGMLMQSNILGGNLGIYTAETDAQHCTYSLRLKIDKYKQAASAGKWGKGWVTVVFRYADKDNFYIYSLCRAGGVGDTGLSRKKNGKWTSFQKERLLTGFKGADEGKWRDIKIEIVPRKVICGETGRILGAGQAIRCYLDGKLITEGHDDDPLVGGALGIRASACRVMVDDVKIISHDPNFKLPEVSYIPVPRITTIKTRTAPVIDGKLSDKCWRRRARKVKLNSTITGKGRVTQPTDAYISYDNENLYLAFQCHEAGRDKIKAAQKGKGHDAGIWADDLLEIFIDPTHGHADYFHFAVNPLGARYDAVGNNSKWNSDAWKAVGKIGEKSWTMEMSIPFYVLGLGSGEHIIGLNLCRQDKPTGELSAWSCLMEENFHRPIRFGHLAGIKIEQACKIKDINLGKVVERTIVGKKVRHIVAGKNVYQATIKNDSGKKLELDVKLNIEQASGKKDVAASTIALVVGEEKQISFDYTTSETGAAVFELTLTDRAMKTIAGRSAVTMAMKPAKIIVESRPTDPIQPLMNFFSLGVCGQIDPGFDIEKQIANFSAHNVNALAYTPNLNNANRFLDRLEAANIRITIQDSTLIYPNFYSGLSGRFRGGKDRGNYFRRVLAPQARKIMPSYRDKWGLLCWYLIDEPSGMITGEMEDYFNLVMTIDPKRGGTTTPMNGNHIEILAAYGNPPHVMMPDVYRFTSRTNTHEALYGWKDKDWGLDSAGKMRKVSSPGYLDTVDKCCALARPMGMGVWMLPQSFATKGWEELKEQGLDHRPMPTANEMKIQAWAAIAHGATGICYFNYSGSGNDTSLYYRSTGTNLEPHWSAIGEVFGDLRRFGPLLVSMAPARYLNPAAEIVKSTNRQVTANGTGIEAFTFLRIDSQAKPVGSERYIIAANVDSIASHKTGIKLNTNKKIYDLELMKKISAQALSEQVLQPGDGNVYLVGTEKDFAFYKANYYCRLNVNKGAFALGTRLAGYKTEKSFNVFTPTKRGELKWRAEADTPWVRLIPAAGVTSDSQSVKVSFDTSGLKPGAHPASITIASNAGTKIIPVSLVITEDSFTPLAARVDFGKVMKGVNLIKRVRLTSNSKELRWQAKSETDWITVITGQGATTEPEATVRVKINTSRAGLGRKEGAIVISSGRTSKRLAILADIIPVATKLPAGEVLFYDDFSAYPEGSDGSPNWEIIGSAEWKVRNGSIVQSDTGVSSEFLLGGESDQADCTYQARIKVNEFHYEGWSHEKRRKKRGWIGLLYAFQNRRDYQTFCLVRGGPGLIKEPGKWHDIMVVVSNNGKTVQCYFDGKLMTKKNYTFSRLPAPPAGKPLQPGRIGFIISEAAVEIDDVMIYRAKSPD